MVCVVGAARPHALHEVAAWVMMKFKFVGNRAFYDIVMYTKAVACGTD